MSKKIPSFVYEDADALGLELSEEQWQKLADYLELLLEANKRMNLTAIKDKELAWRRLIVDSLTVLPGIDAPLLDDEPVNRLLDLGSGGGMPGIPVAIARPDLQVTLLEATGKKVKFHHEVIEKLALHNVRSFQARAEAFGHLGDHRSQYDVITSRALGVMSLVLEYGMPLLREGGRFLAMKGPRAEQELVDAEHALDILGCAEIEVVEAWPESFGNDLVIVCCHKVMRTPDEYPRDGSLIKKKPL